MVIAAGTAFVGMAIYGVVTFSSYPGLATMVLGSSNGGWIAAAMTLPVAVLVLALFVTLVRSPSREEDGVSTEPAP